MKSQTSQVARSCRIREQAAMGQECRNRPNGMSVDEWCRANNITKTNYYYCFELKDISLIIVFPLKIVTPRSKGILSSQMPTPIREPSFNPSQVDYKYYNMILLNGKCKLL